MNVAISSPVILTGESSLALQLSSNSCSVVDHEKNQIWEEKGLTPILIMVVLLNMDFSFLN